MLLILILVSNKKMFNLNLPKMKKFKLLALALLIGTFGLFASNFENPDVTKKELRNQIIELLQTPYFPVEGTMTITLKFTFNSEGEIVVLCPGCKNKDVVKYIRENLNYKKFKNPGIRDKIYKMPLTIEA